MAGGPIRTPTRGANYTHTKQKTETTKARVPPPPTLLHTCPRRAVTPRRATLCQPKPYPGRQRNLPPCPEPTTFLLPLPRYIATSAYRPTLPMRSSSTAAVHSSPRIRRPGESQFPPPHRIDGTACLHCQPPTATPPRHPYPPAGEYNVGPPSCSTAPPFQSPGPAVPSPGCGHPSNMPLHHPLSPGAGVIP